MVVSDLYSLAIPTLAGEELDEMILVNKDHDGISYKRNDGQGKFDDWEKLDVKGLHGQQLKDHEVMHSVDELDHLINEAAIVKKSMKR